MCNTAKPGLWAAIIAVIFSLSGFSAGVLSEYEIIDLGTLGGRRSSARAINDAGQVVGNFAPLGGYDRAFLWDHIDGMVDLGVLAGCNYSCAYALNDCGKVVGESGLDDDFRAFVWEHENGMIDFSELVGASCG